MVNSKTEKKALPHAAIEGHLLTKVKPEVVSYRWEGKK